MCFPFLLWLTNWFRKESAKTYRVTREKVALVIVQFVESMLGIRAVQAFRREPRNQEIFDDVNEQYRAANLRAFRLPAEDRGQREDVDALRRDVPKAPADDVADTPWHGQVPRGMDGPIDEALGREEPDNLAHEEWVALGPRTIASTTEGGGSRSAVDRTYEATSAAPRPPSATRTLAVRLRSVSRTSSPFRSGSGSR